ELGRRRKSTACIYAVCQRAMPAIFHPTFQSTRPFLLLNCSYFNGFYYRIPNPLFREENSCLGISSTCAMASLFVGRELVERSATFDCVTNCPYWSVRSIFIFCASKRPSSCFTHIWHSSLGLSSPFHCR